MKRRNRPPKPKFFERANPNDLWQTDIMTFMIKAQYRVYLIGFMDDHSRLIVGWGLHRFQAAANEWSPKLGALDTLKPPAPKGKIPNLATPWANQF